MGDAISKDGDEYQLPVLHGVYLSGVVFVMDYHQLQFHGSLLNACAPPVVLVGGREVRQGMEGYRDRLCEQIAKVVVATRVRPDSELRIDFEDGSALTIPFRDEKRAGMEAVIFWASLPSKDWMVWHFV
jgi:hypothetical protein